MSPLLSIPESLLTSSQIVDWGYTQELIPRTWDKFNKWVEDNKHGPLNYLSDHRKDLRKNIKSVYPDCESALVFLFDYSATKKSLQYNESHFKVASYALGFDGEDYHYWIADKLQAIGKQLSSDIPELEFEISLDIHPVLERDLAFRSGLGWFGKNSMLINQKIGSYTLIGSLLLNQKLNFSTSKTEIDHCGQCTRCIDSCPTAAIDPQSRTLEASKCISTYTIELFKEGDVPKGYPTKSGEVFGCDICQEVCPWNHKPLERAQEKEMRTDKILHFFNRDKEQILNELKGMSNKSYKNYFKKTSLERLGKRGLIKNIEKY